MRQELVLGLKRKESCLNLGHTVYELLSFFSESGVFKLFLLAAAAPSLISLLPEPLPD